ncbi:MAG: GyrI-like domain-containing protein [Chthoniobacteraceae bacterium]
MLNTPELIELSAQTTAVVRLNIPCEECPQHWGPAVAELFAELDRQGIAPAGPVFDHHFAVPDTHFDFEIGVPTSKPVAPNGRVIPSERPAFRAAKAVLVGDYEQLPDAWPEFMRWISAQGLQTADDFWQFFVKGPESGPDPATYRTELVRAVQS